MSYVAERNNTAIADIEANAKDAIALGRTHLAAIVEPACPTASFLGALASELAMAAGDAASVPFPELVEPDTYWDAVVRPQDQSVRSASADVVAHVETRLAQLVAEAGEEMEHQIELAIDVAASDPIGTRAAVVDEITTRGQWLHHLVAELIGVVPSDAPVREARDRLEDDRRRQAIADVERLKVAYLRDAGGDDAHQQYAAQQWSETFADRVAHRDALLRSEVPWRHQELAVVGHEGSRAAVTELVNEAVTRLQESADVLGDELVARYDERAARA